MKRCNACGEEFEDKYSFCPVDATPLNSLVAAVVNEHAPVDSRAVFDGGNPPPEFVSVTRTVSAKSSPEFHLTIIDNTSLGDRLARELRFLSYQVRQAWPAFRRDPIACGRDAVFASGLRLRRALADPNSIAASATAMLVVVTVVLVLVLSDQRSKENYSAQSENAELENIVALTFPNPSPKADDRGVGAGTKGRVGLAAGKGEGSLPEPRKARGGGAGGQHDQPPPQVGKVPQPSEIPAPIPKFPPVKNQALPVAGIDIDAALWKNLPMAVYGDPRSKSSVPSNGPGDRGGMGTANGSGIGEGDGPGFGPGRDGNIGGDRKRPGGGGQGGSFGNSSEDPDHIYPPPQVTERARVLMKPEPQYTEDARKNAITGSVVLRVVFSRTGEVTNIRAVQTLPFGLTERAIAAARMIRFRPATKDGRAVNVYMQLEYNFNLY